MYSFVFCRRPGETISRLRQAAAGGRRVSPGVELLWPAYAFIYIYMYMCIYIYIYTHIY